MDIRLVEHADIDKVKWNSCIHYAWNGNIFGYKWFLDGSNREWDALVEGDYETVLPLLWRRTWSGKKELHIPPLVREAGIYSINMLSPARIQRFLDAIPPTLRKGTFHLNQGSPSFLHDDWKIKEATNYQMLLENSYPKLAEAYSDPLKSRLEKASEKKLIASGNLKPERLAAFFKQHTPQRKGKDQTYHALLRIMYNALHRGWGFSTAILSPNEQLLAAGFFLISHSRLYNLITISSPEGKQTGAPDLLLDLVLRSNAGKPFLLDFNLSSTLLETKPEDWGGQQVFYYSLAPKNQSFFS